MVSFPIHVWLVFVLVQVLIIDGWYEIAYRGFSSKRTCIVESKTVALQMNVSEDTGLMHAYATLTLSVENGKKLFSVENKHISLRRAEDFLKSRTPESSSGEEKEDTEQPRVTLNIRIDLGDQEHHRLEQSYKAKPYQTCYYKDGVYLLEPSREDFSPSAVFVVASLTFFEAAAAIYMCCGASGHTRRY